MQSIKLASKKFIKSPMDNIMNIFIMTIFISILFLVLSISKASSNWESHSLQYPQIMIFLKDKTTRNDVTELENTINKYYKKYIYGYEFISKEQGLNDLKTDDKLNQVINDDIIESNNPLPDILIVKTNTANSVFLKKMHEHIKNMPKVDSTNLNDNYVNKVSDFVSFLRYLTSIFQISFIAIIAITIYNTIRLQMFINRDEILVSRLIGAPDTFIMRPLSYFALIQTTLGTVLAYLISNLFINYTNITINKYSHLFGSKFNLINLNLIETLQVYSTLLVFTVFAVFIAVRSVLKHNTLN